MATDDLINKPLSGKQRQARYYAKHKKECNARSLAYNAQHREELKAYKAAYHEIHPRFIFLGEELLLFRHDKPPKGYVYHHTCYDHTDKEANLVLLSRSSHTMGHQLLKKLGIEIPHINRR